MVDKISTDVKTPETKKTTAKVTVKKEPRKTIRQASLADIAPSVADTSPVATPAARRGAKSPEGVESGKPQLDAKGRMYATGRRKNAVARVWIRPGSGKVVVNDRGFETYFARPTLRMIINQPLAVAGRAGQYDVECTIVGGGLSGQAGALRHGISRALSCFEPGLRAILKTNGFLTRDSRVVERKKYGRAKARRRFQFSKR